MACPTSPGAATPAHARRWTQRPEGANRGDSGAGDRIGPPAPGRRGGGKGGGGGGGGGAPFVPGPPPPPPRGAPGCPQRRCACPARPVRRSPRWARTDCRSRKEIFSMHSSTAEPRSVQKVCRILSELTNPGPHRLSNIVANTRLNKATVLRLLESLIEDGFVLRDAQDKTYWLGNEALVMAAVI